MKASNISTDVENETVSDLDGNKYFIIMILTDKSFQKTFNENIYSSNIFTTFSFPIPYFKDSLEKNKF